MQSTKALFPVGVPVYTNIATRVTSVAIQQHLESCIPTIEQKIGILGGTQQWFDVVPQQTWGQFLAP